MPTGLLTICLPAASFVRPLLCPSPSSPCLLRDQFRQSTSLHSEARSLLQHSRPGHRLVGVLRIALRLACRRNIFGAGTLEDPLSRASSSPNCPNARITKSALDQATLVPLCLVLRMPMPMSAPVTPANRAQPRRPPTRAMIGPAAMNGPSPGMAVRRYLSAIRACHLTTAPVPAPWSRLQELSWLFGGKIFRADILREQNGDVRVAKTFARNASIARSTD